MLIPIRCFSCGKLIGDKFEPYLKMKEEGVPIEEIWQKLGIKKFCCKRMLSSQKDIIDDLLEFIRLQ